MKYILHNIRTCYYNTTYITLSYKPTRDMIRLVFIDLATKNFYIPYLQYYNPLFITKHFWRNLERIQWKCGFIFCLHCYTHGERKITYAPGFIKRSSFGVWWSIAWGSRIGIALTAMATCSGSRFSRTPFTASTSVFIFSNGSCSIEGMLPSAKNLLSD